MLEDFLKKADDPKWTGEIVFQPMAPHCWGPRGSELFDKIIAQIDKYAPAGADLKSWRYCHRTAIWNRLRSTSWPFDRR
jgi:hypothetical protein